MVRFSCFQVQSHSHKHKKTVPQSSEALQKTLIDSSQNRAPTENPCISEENKPCLKEEGEQNHVYDHMTDYSPTASEEIVTKYITDDIISHKKAHIKKSKSLASDLNWEQRTSGHGGSGIETEQISSYDGNKNGSDQFPEPILSTSVRVDSDFAKDNSIFSSGDPQRVEKEGDHEDDICLSGVVQSGDITPCIVRSNSLPRICSPNRSSTTLIARSRSAEALNNLVSRNEGFACKTGRELELEHQDNPISVYENEKTNDENPADEPDEAYNYVGSSKDWIVPVPDKAGMGKFTVGESSYRNWDEVPAKDFRLKRIEDWVSSLQCGGPVDDPIDDFGYTEESSKDNALLEELAALKSEAKVSPAMEAAKRYISSLNASATSAQLTNLGLIVIPFLSSFGSLKALNLSGNAIVRIAAGALPRGLHILNLSRNNISIVEGLRDLTRLRVLDLSYNRILRIGHGLAACSSLKELYLAGNKISEVEGLHRLLKLNVLDFRFNKISTTKCLGQLAANYNCLQALSLDGNPAQKNVGDDPLRKYILSLLPHLTYYNRCSIKPGTTKDATERSARLAMAGARPEAKAHGSLAWRKGGPAAVAKGARRGHGRLPPKIGGDQRQVVVDGGGKVMCSSSEFSFPRSRSEGNLGRL